MTAFPSQTPDDTGPIAAELRKAAEDRGQAATAFLGRVLTELGRDLQQVQPGDLARDLAAYGRRNPLSFMTLAAVAGFSATRLAPEASGPLAACTETSPDQAERSDG
ncbi:MAG: hypothetical protein KDA50_14430 [Rhodobacteraceae bacterium]|nr:hypothetical protein [Paracoccaceae bacterium]